MSGFQDSETEYPILYFDVSDAGVIYLYVTYRGRRLPSHNALLMTPPPEAVLRKIVADLNLPAVEHKKLNQILSTARVK